MNFSWWFSKKIALGKSKKNKLSAFIIFIGQLAVVIGIVVSLITISTGIGARKAIKQKLADFNGHIVIKALNSNLSYNADSIKIDVAFHDSLTNVDQVVHAQNFATKSGMIRTSENFDGVVLKGVGENFDKKRFKKFITKGKFPEYNKDYSQEVVISEKIANELKLDIDSSFMMVFLSLENQRPQYRRFNISGLYRTDVKQFDDIFIYGDIKHVQKLNQWESNTVGGVEIFVKDVENVDEVEKQLNKIIPYNLQAESSKSLFSAIESWINVFNTNILSILIIMVFVVVMNMIMVLLILIVHRTNSIGLLKAYGANNFTIQNVFVNYAIFVMVPGLLIGNLLGLGLLWFQKQTEWLKLPSPENYYLSTVPIWLDYQFFLIVIGINLLMIVISGVILLLSSLIISNIRPSKTIKFG